MQTHKKLIILDLDETLIHGSTKDLFHGTKVIAPDFYVHPYKIHLRPYVHEFINFCRIHFNVAIWSSGTNDYVTSVTKTLFTNIEDLVFIWSREKCIKRDQIRTMAEISSEPIWIKDLKKVEKLGFTLNKVIVVDDSPEKLCRNYGNLVAVNRFTGASSDNELKILCSYLAHLNGHDDVRRIEKRGWKNRLVAGREIN